MRLETLLPSFLGVQFLEIGLWIRPIRALLHDSLQRQVYFHIVEQNPLEFPVAVRKDKYAMIIYIMMAIDRGGDLNTVFFSPFFEKIRHWQKDYFLNRPAAEAGNPMVPCPVRDHHGQMRDIAAETGAKPLDEDSARAFADSTYYEQMVQYGRDIDELSRCIWDEEYLNGERRES
jgi:hypothetical protein